VGKVKERESKRGGRTLVERAVFTSTAYILCPGGSNQAVLVSLLRTWLRWRSGEGTVTAYEEENGDRKQEKSCELDEF
jgi:hypothetical protein